MATLGQRYDRESLPEATSFDPIPIGWYLATITSSDVKATKDGTGTYIDLQFTVVGPEYVGRIIFEKINIRNNSQKAEEIGLGTLRSLLAAASLPAIEDSDELLNATVEIKVGLEKPQEGYEQRNNIKEFRAASGTIPQTGTVQPPAAFCSARPSVFSGRPQSTPASPRQTTPPAPRPQTAAGSPGKAPWR